MTWCCDLRWGKGFKYEYYCIESAAHSSETFRFSQFHRVSQADTRTHTHSLHSKTQHLDELCYFEPRVGRRIGDIKIPFWRNFVNFPRFVEFSGRAVISELLHQTASFKQFCRIFIFAEMADLFAFIWRI